jgi:hypothetical protein
MWPTLAASGIRSIGRRLLVHERAGAPAGGLTAMGCLFVVLGALAPRTLILLVWLARPNLVDAAFDGFILPLLGIVFLPYTTLMYLLVHTSGLGVAGSDWIFIALAVGLDIIHTASAAADSQVTQRWRD